MMSLSVSLRPSSIPAFAAASFAAISALCWPPSASTSTRMRSLPSAAAAACAQASRSATAASMSSTQRDCRVLVPYVR
eukprot:908880-Prymnesium_polylepis.2